MNAPDVGAESAPATGDRRSGAVVEGPGRLGRRLGPVVALIGVLGAVLTLAWVALAPDNVVGPIEDAPFGLVATALVHDSAGDGCLRVVDGSGRSQQVCVDDGPVWSAQWTEDGAIVAWVDDRGLDERGERRVLVDPTTGDVTPVDDDVDDAPLDRYRALARIDGERAFSPTADGDGDGDGETVLDLGGPAGRLDSAVVSPDGDHAVAVDGDGRVLVTATARPDEVYVWFRLDEDTFLDLSGAVRWDE